MSECIPIPLNLRTSRTRSKALLRSVIQHTAENKVIRIWQYNAAFFTSIYTACKWIITCDRYFKLGFSDDCQKIKYRKRDLILKYLISFSLRALF